MMIVALVDRLINSKVFNQLQPFIQLYQVCWDLVESRPVDRGPWTVDLLSYFPMRNAAAPAG
jgi:hypothetical protein